MSVRQRVERAHEIYPIARVSALTQQEYAARRTMGAATMCRDGSPSIFVLNPQPLVTETECELMISEYGQPDRHVLIGPGRCRFGRDISNDVRLHSTMISRFHVILVLHTNGILEVYDEASRNDSYCNGKRIGVDPAVLKSGDEIILGGVVYYAAAHDHNSAVRITVRIDATPQTPEEYLLQIISCAGVEDIATAIMDTPLVEWPTSEFLRMRNQRIWNAIMAVDGLMIKLNSHVGLQVYSSKAFPRHRELLDGFLNTDKNKVPWVF